MTNKTLYTKHAEIVSLRCFLLILLPSYVCVCMDGAIYIYMCIAMPTNSPAAPADATSRVSARRNIEILQNLRHSPARGVRFWMPSQQGAGAASTRGACTRADTLAHELSCPDGRRPRGLAVDRGRLSCLAPRSPRLLQVAVQMCVNN